MHQRGRSAEKVFCDPVHDLITFNLPEDRLLVELVATRAMQRLRRIRQLGVTALVYHGAEHSRFGHALGVCHLARTIGERLRSRHRHEPHIAEGLELHLPFVALAALLHDIGHGPFSHLFEAVAPDARGRTHEDWTVALIRDPSSEVHRILSSHGADTPDRVAAIIDRTCDSRLAVDIISSQLDADRLDYLQRDSLMTGTGYGRFDAPWLLHAMLAGEVPGRDGGSSLALCVDGRKGIHAVEGYVLARHLMYLQVYFHKTGRAFEAQVLALLRAARHLVTGGDETVAGACHPVLAAVLGGHTPTLDEYLELDDLAATGAMAAWARLEGSPERRLLARGAADLHLDRRPWQALAVPDGAEAPVRSLLADLDDELGRGTSLHRLSVHLDTPSSHVYKDLVYRAGDGGGDPARDSIMVASPDGVIPVEEHPAAHVIRSLSRVAWAGRRLYVDRGVLAELGPRLRRAGLDA